MSANIWSDRRLRGTRILSSTAAWSLRPILIKYGMLLIKEPRARRPVQNRRCERFAPLQVCRAIDLVSALPDQTDMKKPRIFATLRGSRTGGVSLMLF